MSITRRDFLNGVALTVVAGLTPWDLARAQENGIAEKAGEYYPPSLMGLRGNHPGSFEMAHALGREHQKFDFDSLTVEEEYDLVIGAASAAWRPLVSGSRWQVKIKRS